MYSVKANEREFRSLVISWFNSFLVSGTYPFELATGDPSIKISSKKTKFPDVQIWINREAGQGFCGMELKTPETSVDDQELLENAAEKARAMRAKWFVTWNMCDTTVWRTPRINESVQRVHAYHTYDCLQMITNADDLKNGSKRHILEERARNILNDISILCRQGHLNLIEVDTTFFVKMLSDAVNKLWPYFKESLGLRVGQDPAFRKGLYDWAAKQGIADYENPEFLDIVSRQIVYRLLGKILFYITLRRCRSDVRKLELHDVAVSEISKELRNRFNQVARDIDYQAIFEEDFIDTFDIPSQASTDIVNLIDDLNNHDFAHMPQDVVGQVFERLIPPEERHNLGQYFTREDLVDVIDSFCIRRASDKVLDPTCGTGTFLLRAYDRFKYLGTRDHKTLLSRLWGIDIAGFPAELAMINLYRQNLEDYANFPRIITGDFFDVKPNQIFRFPPPKPSDKKFLIEEQMPMFDAIVGNFPYIRQEIIERRIKGYKKTITKVIASGWLEVYPELFKMSGNVADEIEKVRRSNLPQVGFYDKVDLILSGKADIFAFLFIHVARFLQENRRMGIVTSSAWMETEYGFELQKFFLRHFKVVAILMSMEENWFVDVPVITCVTILEKCGDEAQRSCHHVKFVKVKKRLERLLPFDAKTDVDKRWNSLEKMVQEIECAGVNSPEGDIRKKHYISSNVATYEDDNFRIRAVEQQRLLKELEERKKTGKWGLFLRAPDLYFEVTHECRDKLVSINEVADIDWGIKTGINEFFYLTKEKIRHWGIEAEFLMPIVTSLKEINNIVIDTNTIEYMVLVCGKSKAELLRTGKHAVLEYIKWGEKQKTRERGRYKRGGVPFPQVSSVQGREFWYRIDKREPCDFIISQFIRERFFFPVNKVGLLIGNIAFEGRIRDKRERDFYCAILNSALVFLFVELAGRFSMGDGLLTFYGPDIDELVIPDGRRISADLKGKIVESYETLLKRPVLTIEKEVAMHDRQKFDAIVLKSLGLDPKQYLEPLYKNLCLLVSKRINLGKTRRRGTVATKKSNADEFKERLMKEIMPKGPKQFPVDFVDAACFADAVEISVPKEPLRLGNFFMGKQEITTDGGFHYVANSVSEAKYIIYAQTENSYVMRIPKNVQILELAVKSYDDYLHRVQNELSETIFKRTQDQKLTEMLLSQILEDLGLVKH